ncbi:DNA polymerase IV [Glutamicibacter sp. PS]|uniref:DNA polymerase IV n=1 Tax=Glutamicibacter sp. PS TaxID=3075634 RepID=UPI00283D11DA|nr:DNA polymerase IV [Glutamicibacter sp. PS]MDR4532401.1 DNA polymerase IV [Glutamicibacter sp. PS]
MEPGPERAILHVDMDAFFVSVEQLYDPELASRPVIVGSPQGRSVVLSASYDCRALGVRSAMPMSKAMALAPHAVIVPPHRERYEAASRAVMEYFATITPLLEQVSIDEAFLDVTGSMRLLGGPVNIAHQIRQHIAHNLGLPSSVGIARNKFVAKLASTRAKPNGLIVVPPERTLEFLHELPIAHMWGVGAKTREQLLTMGIASIADLAAQPVSRLVARFGESGRSLHQLALGIDDRPVQPEHQEKSISVEHTLATDLRDPQAVERELVDLAYRLGRRLRRQGHTAAGLGLKLKYADFSVANRSRTLPAATDSTATLAREAKPLLQKLLPLAQPVRLIGLRVEKLGSPSEGLQFTLDESGERERESELAIDRINERFPGSAVKPASLLGPPTERSRAEQSLMETSELPRDGHEKPK